MADLLFRHQQELSDALYDTCAQQLELDLPAFTRDRDAAAAREKIIEDFHAGREGGVTTIPTLFVDGIRECGGYDVRSLRALLDARRSAANHEEPTA